MCPTLQQISLLAFQDLVINKMGKNNSYFQRRLKKICFSDHLTYLLTKHISQSFIPFGLTAKSHHPINYWLRGGSRLNSRTDSRSSQCLLKHLFVFSWPQTSSPDCSVRAAKSQASTKINFTLASLFLSDINLPNWMESECCPQNALTMVWRVVLPSGIWYCLQASKMIWSNSLERDLFY